MAAIATEATLTAIAAVARGRAAVTARAPDPAISAIGAVGTWVAGVGAVGAINAIGTVTRVATISAIPDGAAVTARAPATCVRHRTRWWAPAGAAGATASGHGELLSIAASRSGRPGRSDTRTCCTTGATDAEGCGRVTSVTSGTAVGRGGVPVGTRATDARLAGASTAATIAAVPVDAARTGVTTDTAGATVASGCTRVSAVAAGFTRDGADVTAPAVTGDSTGASDTAVAGDT